MLRLPVDAAIIGPVDVTDKITLAEAAAFADGEVLRLTFARVGGQWISELWTFAGEGLTWLSLIEMARALRRGTGRIAYRRHREVANEWANHGVDSVPSLELTRFVKAQRAWPMATFMSLFGLDRQEARALLVVLGYRYDSTDDDVWVEDVED